jgi:mRNA-degrading endonuclease toxin of MazEF toxin-antitoxin module
VRTLDWRARRARAMGFASREEMQEIQAKLGALIGTDF